MVNPSVPANSHGRADRARQGEARASSTSRRPDFGAAAHLAGELFKTEAKINIVHVAYKGAAPALQDVLAGHVQMMFATAASVIGLIKNDKVRALAVTTPKRTALLPDLPTVDELGIKGFDATTWHGLVAPAGTPKEIIDTLNFRHGRGAEGPGHAESADRPRRRHHRRLRRRNSRPTSQAEIPKWTAVVKQSGAQIE